MFLSSTIWLLQVQLLLVCDQNWLPVGSWGWRCPDWTKISIIYGWIDFLGTAPLSFEMFCHHHLCQWFRLSDDTFEMMWYRYRCFCLCLCLFVYNCLCLCLFLVQQTSSLTNAAMCFGWFQLSLDHHCLSLSFTELLMMMLLLILVQRLPHWIW